MKLEIKDIFPIPIGMGYLEREFTEIELNAFKKELLHLYPNPGSPSNTNTNANTINHRVLECVELKKLKEEITNLVIKYYEQYYNPLNSNTLYITQSWINISKQGDHHHEHFHLNSFLSGVLYIKTDEEKDCILLKNPLPAHFLNICDPCTRDLTYYTSGYARISAKPNTLLLFPSRLSHSVPLVETKERISLAFNTFLSGDIGEDNKLNLLNVSRNS